MRFLRRLAGILGFMRDGAHDPSDGAAGEEEEEEEEEGEGENEKRRRASKGFSVQVPVVIDRPALGPVLIPCRLGEGGVQGLRWYSRRLRVDEDGDVADEFLDEIQTLEASNSADHQLTTAPRFQVQYTAIRPVVKKQIIAIDGNVRHNIEHQGRLLWV